MDATFTVWSNKGIRTIQELFIGDVLLSSLQLSQIYNPPKTHFFHHLQIRSFVQKTFNSFPDKTTQAQFNCILEVNSDRKGLIAQVYEFIGNIITHTTAHLKKAWDTDLGVVLAEDQWNSILGLIDTSSTSTHPRME